MTENPLHGIMQTSLYPFRLGQTAQDTLQEFIDIDVTADDLVRILNSNQAYKNIFASFVEQKTKASAKSEASDPSAEKKVSPTHRLISLLGMIGSRNFILALRIHKATTGAFPTFQEKVPFSAPEILKRSLEIEELFQRNKFDYPETIYAAAATYDWLYYLATKHKNFKKLEPYFQETWKSMQRHAILAHCLAARSTNFAFHKYAPAAAMLTQIGRLHLALSYSEPENGSPSWLDFEELQTKNNTTATIARDAREKTEFGFTVPELSALSLHFYTVFETIEPAVRFYREPYFLKKMDPMLYKFAIFLELVNSMARSWKIPADEKDSLVKSWERPWHNDLGIKKSQWIEALKVAMNLR